MGNGHTDNYIVGVDEAGRGPIAGPVAVAAVAVLKPIPEGALDGVKDSKKLTKKRRDHFRSIIDELEVDGVLKTATYMSASAVIDGEGIVPAITQALQKALAALALPPEECQVLLDGSLKAPPEYTHQETIIKGDETELAITLAGIMAKTTRDAEMLVLDAEYPEYGFGRHKGYGTKAHYEAIAEYGPCPEHRTTWLSS